MNTQDFRNEDPVWVKYAEFVGQGSDKFYETTIHMGDDARFYLQKRWGRNPDTGDGQIKVETYTTLNAAQAMANDIFRKKIAKGYAVVERPYSASLNVAKEYDDEEY